ncbi:uncharacterized protein LOC143877587 isoform X2 [Tasmannia lanceolata]|uniref:uncharacterized protein LOC143877587 isoform X2 n=1 Tax=Tasmannia lanceolata TaxID=3420 RepID=UPI00406314B6
MQPYKGIGATIYLIWAYTPEPCLYSLGITYYPSRQRNHFSHYIFEFKGFPSRASSLNRHATCFCTTNKTICRVLSGGDHPLQEPRSLPGLWSPFSLTIEKLYTGLRSTWTSSMNPTPLRPHVKWEEAASSSMEANHGYWALSLPAFAMVAVVLAMVFYIGLNFMVTPLPTSLNTMFDVHCRERSMFVASGKGEVQPIEPISDISISQINDLMFR